MIARRGMALAATLGVLSLISILAVATLSLSGRLLQGSSLAVRDARLDGAAGFGLASVSQEWRSRRLGILAPGSSAELTVAVNWVPASVAVTVTRIGPDLFWVVSQATGSDGSSRRENLVLRARIPDPVAVLAEDSSNVASLAFLMVDSLAATADLVLSSGTQATVPTGVVRAAGDLTLTGGSGEGILIVEGRLTVIGPLYYRGIIISRGGISVASGGVQVSGVVRSGEMVGEIAHEPSLSAVQDVLAQSVIPVAVAGRRWAEVY